MREHVFQGQHLSPFMRLLGLPHCLCPTAPSSLPSSLSKSVRSHWELVYQYIYQSQICVVYHATGTLWRQWGFLAPTGHPIAHAVLVSKLLKAIQLPSTLAVIHCKAHLKDDSWITKGNQYPDATAKWVATQPMTSSVTLPILGIEAKILYQDFLE